MHRNSSESSFTVQELAQLLRRYLPNVAYALLGYFAAAYMFKLWPFPKPIPVNPIPERRLVLILDCSNNKLVSSEVDAIIGDSVVEPRGIAGDFLKEWKDKGRSRPWEIDFAYVNDKSETNSIKKVVLGQLSGNRSDIDADFEKKVKEVRKQLEHDPGRGVGTQIIRTVSSVMSKLPIDKEDHTLQVGIVSNFLEQDKELDINLAGLTSTPTIYKSKVHDKFRLQLIDAIDKYGSLDFHKADVKLLLTKSDKSKGIHKVVLERMWTTALEAKGCTSIEMDVLQ